MQVISYAQTMCIFRIRIMKTHSRSLNVLINVRIFGVYLKSSFENRPGIDETTEFHTHRFHEYYSNICFRKHDLLRGGNWNQNRFPSAGKLNLRTQFFFVESLQQLCKVIESSKNFLNS